MNDKILRNNVNNESNIWTIVIILQSNPIKRSSLLTLLKYISGFYSIRVVSKKGNSDTES